MTAPKMPEPAFRLRWDTERAGYYVNKPNIGDTDVFTRDQLAAVHNAALEWAAQQCQSMMPAGGRAWSSEQAACFACLDELAAAIRAGMKESGNG